MFLKPYTLWDKDPATLMILNHTTERNSVSNKYLQTRTDQPKTNVFLLLSSLQQCGIKRKGLRVRFAIFQQNYMPDVPVNETVATVEKLGDLCNSGAMNGLPVFVMK